MNRTKTYYIFLSICCIFLLSSCSSETESNNESSEEFDLEAIKKEEQRLSDSVEAYWMNKVNEPDTISVK
jgi:hypothetical protein